MKLVVVESPAKCKKIASFLGPDFQVLATMGHIRALEEDLDAVGIDRDFEPKYRFLVEKAKATKALLEAAKSADTIYLAADDDREGEAIAYSVACLLKKDPASLPRAVFHEITSKAVRDAVANPRRLDMNRVNAQQARAVLDMLVGFTISPLLWKHVAYSLSAGRCQTPALRLVADRESSITNHSTSVTWSLVGSFSSPSLTKGSRMPSLTETAGLLSFQAKMDDELEDHESSLNYMENIYNSSSATVTNVSVKAWTLNPPKPLITSTLQQEASALFNLNPKSTMKIAQSLYEGGHITYMRTDHAVLSEEAITAAQQYVRENYGEKYVGVVQQPKPKAPKKKESKTDDSKSSAAAQAQPQEAHECIRPTHFEFSELSGADWTAIDKKVYHLIWRRAVQATMAQAKGNIRTATLTLDSDEDKFPWSASWRTTEFEGWQKLGKPAKLDDSDEDSDESSEPEKAKSLKEGTTLEWSSIQAAPKSTKPAPRFTEATLIRELEQKGIGRPSTFASLVEVLFDKKYVEKKDIPGTKSKQTTLLLKPTEWPPASSTKDIVLGAEKQKLTPTPLGLSVLTFCLKEFPQLFSYDFTANMEQRLDSVAKGEELWKQLCRDTWASYKSDYERLSSKANTPSNSEKVKDFGGGLKAVMSKNGPLLVMEEEGKAKFYPFPSSFTLQTITEDIAREHIEDLKLETSLGVFNGQTIEKKKGPYGLYAQSGSLKVPILEGESLESIMKKLKEKSESTSSQTRVGGYVFAVGPYGPYMFKDGLKTKQFISVPEDVDPKKLTLAQAEDMYKKGVETKKQAASNGSFRGGRGGFRGRGGSARGGH